MNDREKLVELLTLSPYGVSGYLLAAFIDKDQICGIADHLLSHGVTIREPGEWKIITDDYDNEMMECSRCGSDFYDGDNDTVDCLHNFCPNCGAPMKGENK